MDLLPRVALWVGVRLTPGLTLTGRGLRIRASDNIPMLRALGRDPLVIKDTRVDTIWGLVNLMDAALASAPRLHEPLLLMYGANDEIIPKRPMRRFVRTLPHDLGDRRSLAYYEHGYHMLLRDLEGPIVDCRCRGLGADARLRRCPRRRIVTGSRRFWAGQSSRSRRTLNRCTAWSSFGCCSCCCWPTGPQWWPGSCWAPACRIRWTAAWNLPMARPLFGRSKTIRGVMLAVLVDGRGRAAGRPRVANRRDGRQPRDGWRPLLQLFEAPARVTAEQPGESGSIRFRSRCFRCSAVVVPLSLTMADVAAGVVVFFVGELLLSRLLYAFDLRDRPY